jgi:hypothetical protein
MTPFDQYNQSSGQPYLRPATGYIDESQRAALAAALRQGPMQAQQRSSKSPISPEMANKFADWALGLGKEGLPNSSQNVGVNAVTPDFQSGNYGAPTMNMTGAGSITPNFNSTNNFQTPMMQQGFNPSMFKGIY